MVSLAPHPRNPLVVAFQMSDYSYGMVNATRERPGKLYFFFE